MGVDKRQLDDFHKKLQKLNSMQKHAFMQQATKDSAGGFLQIVIKNTPTGDSRKDRDGNTIHVGGALKRAWTARSEQEAENGSKVPSAMVFAKTLDVQRSANAYSVDVVNHMHYASYVENGHRQEPGRFVPAIGKRLKKKWVEGQFFMKNSQSQFSEAWAGFLTSRLDKFLRKTFR